MSRLDDGNQFNTEQGANYSYNELYVEKKDNGKKGGGKKPDGQKSYYRLDSYEPESGKIASRKFTQLAQIQEKTAIGYINELTNKYPVGAVIADVPSSGSLAGLRLQGQLVLEVPIQNAPIPKSVLKAADETGVIIKEVATEIYKK